MPKFNVKILILQPIDIVYLAYIDPDNIIKWMSHLEKFEIIKGSIEEKGAIARLHYNEKGRKYIMEDILEYIEPYKKIISSVEGGVISAKVETRFKDLGNKTELELIWDGKGKKLFLKFLLPLLKNKMIYSAKAELILFKSLVEKHGVKF